MGKIDYTKAPLPIEESNCFAIPLEVIDKNVAYEIVLEMNNSFHARIYVIDKGNRLEVKYIDASKSTCN
ncbi:NF045616 family extracytoplasmic (lipo)protein [Acinetobacter nosocomialis]|uniref:NF045616 family extracytoplasmic (lipo)protein n=1 Tax=Acinetobacter nosocomialis TaxID=106654 RepID=UPI002074B156|nr:NF045616 family extracytoplasmic (lipo)protein [Acinetobacter nosocomialis]